MEWGRKWIAIDELMLKFEVDERLTKSWNWYVRKGIWVFSKSQLVIKVIGKTSTSSNLNKM